MKGEKNLTEETETILVVDDEENIREMLSITMKLAGYKVICAKDGAEAQEKTIRCLKKGRLPNMALIDLGLPGESGADLIGRFSAIIPEMNIIAITGKLISELTGLPCDEGISKPINKDTLLEIVKKLKKPQRISIDPPDIKINWLKATDCFSGKFSGNYMNHIRELKPWQLGQQRFSGIYALKKHTRKFDKVGPQKGVEQIVTTSAETGEFIVTIIYYNKEVAPNKIIIVPMVSRGCSINCNFCINPHLRKNEQGETVIYKGKISTAEFIGQIWHAMMSPLVKEAMADGSELELVINAAGEGESCLNPYEIFEAFRHLSKMLKNKNPKASFIITTVGIEKALQLLLTEYADILPFITFYFSLNFREEMRRGYMPGTDKESLKRLRDLFIKFALINKRQLTFSWIVFNGINDTIEDANWIADFIGDLPPGAEVEVKLMAEVEDSLKRGKTTSDQAVINFGKLLEIFNIKYRIREIVGTGPDRCGFNAAWWMIKC